MNKYVQSGLLLKELLRLQKERIRELDEDRERALEPMRAAPGSVLAWDEPTENGHGITVALQTSRYQREVWREEQRFRRWLAGQCPDELTPDELAAFEAEKASRAAKTAAKRAEKARTAAENKARRSAAVKARDAASERADKAGLPRPKDGFSPTEVRRRGKTALHSIAFPRGTETRGKAPLEAPRCACALGLLSFVRSLAGERPCVRRSGRTRGPGAGASPLGLSPCPRTGDGKG